MSLDTDLPLLANFDEVKVKHYSLDLLCDFDKNAFIGSLLLHIDTEKSESFSSIVLDCCDILISRASSVKKAENIKESVKYGNFEKTCKEYDESTETWNESLVENLEFTQNDWSVTIECKNPVDVIKIEYQTKPDTRSLHWRVDCDGNPCVYTPAASINNRGLFPCQDLPGAMSTWDLTVSLPISSRNAVFCTGDKHARVSKNDTHQKFYFYTSIILPLSTFAIAVGAWEVRDLSTLLSEIMLPVRLIGPSSLLRKSNLILPAYLREAVMAAVDILGPYPLPKLDVLVVPRSFSGLGLASPNLTFISASLLSGDPGLLVKVSHELCHGWFGIMVGAKDWTEAWLSEGFATFLEDFVHQKAVTKLGHESNDVLMKMRAKIKLKSLKAETENVSKDLLELRPMKGEKLIDASDTQFVKNGLNPMAGLSQSHYLKGFFLLHHLKDTIGELPFLKLIQDYFNIYRGQLVDSTEFIHLYYKHYKANAPQSMDRTIADWLDSPRLPNTLEHLTVLQCEHHGLYRDVLDVHHELLDLNQDLQKKKSINIELYSNELRYSEQLNILLNLLLEKKLHGKLLDHLYAVYKPLIQSNPDLLHLWCEIVISNKHRKFYDQLKSFLVEHQSMGVYLYYEMMHSKNKILIQNCKEAYNQVKHELDANLKTVLQDLFSGSG